MVLAQEPSRGTSVISGESENFPCPLPTSFVGNLKIFPGFQTGGSDILFTAGELFGRTVPAPGWVATDQV